MIRQNQKESRILKCIKKLQNSQVIPFVQTFLAQTEFDDFELKKQIAKALLERTLKVQKGLDYQKYKSRQISLLKNEYVKTKTHLKQVKRQECRSKVMLEKLKFKKAEVALLKQEISKNKKLLNLLSRRSSSDINYNYLKVPAIAVKQNSQSEQRNMPLELNRQKITPFLHDTSQNTERKILSYRKLSQQNFKPQLLKRNQFKKTQQYLINIEHTPTPEEEKQDIRKSRLEETQSLRSKANSNCLSDHIKRSQELPHKQTFKPNVIKDVLVSHSQLDLLKSWRVK